MIERERDSKGGGEASGEIICLLDPPGDSDWAVLSQ